MAIIQTGQKKIIAIGFQQALEILSNQPEVGAPPDITYLFDDQFLTDEAAPLVSPRTAEPGPGTLTINDTGNNWSISGGRLVGVANTAWADPGAHSGQYTTVPNGRLVMMFFNKSDPAGRLKFGWHNTDLFDTNLTKGFYITHAETITASDGPGVQPQIFNGPNHNIDWYLIFVQGALGGYYYLKQGSGNWELRYTGGFRGYVDLNNHYHVIKPYNYNGVFDDVRIPDTLSENLDTAQAYDDFSSPTTVAADSGSNGLNGAYSNVGLSGDNGGYFNSDLLSYCDIYSAGLNTAFDGQEFGVIVRAKIQSPDMWDNATNRFMLRCQVEVPTYFYIAKIGSNLIKIRNRRDGFDIQEDFTSITDSGLFGIGFRVSETLDEWRSCKDGILQTLRTGFGTWVGDIDSDICTIGAEDTTPSESWPGWIKNVVITLNGIVPTDIQMQFYTNTANTITAAQLDTDFGAGNWAWWKLDEQHQSLATGPESQSLTQYAHNGQTPRIASGNMSVSPVLGPELDSGTLTIGKWYKITATQVDHFYTGSAINDTFIARAATALDANNKVQQIDIDTSIALLDYNDTNTWFSINPTVTARTQAGLVLRASSLTGLDTASYLHVYCNLIDNLIYVDQVTAGAVTPVTNNAFTYSAGDRLIAWLSGTTLRVYYNETFLFETTVADTGNTIHGAFATDENTQWGEIQVTPVVNTTLAAQFDQYIP